MAKISIIEVTIDGVEYRKVDEEARVGDYVAFAEAPYWYLSDGKMYEVNRIDGDGDPHITDDDGDDFDLTGEEYDVFRAVDDEQLKYREVKRHAKVGERIRIVNPILAFRKYKAGDEFVVDRVYSDGDVLVPEAASSDGNNNGIIFLREYVVLEPVDEEEYVAEPKSRPNFSVGEYARVLRRSGAMHGFSKGDVVKILEYDRQQGIHEIRIKNANTVGYCNAEHLEPATKAEYDEYIRKEMERRKWAEIGREPGEYRKGDIVKLAKIDGIHGLDGTTGVITEIDEVDNAHHMRYHVVRPEGVGISGFDTWTKSEMIAELICPVEKRFDGVDRN